MARSIINLFNDISDWRGSGMNGPNHISLQDIQAYSTYYKAVISSYQLDLIKMLDKIYVRAYHEAHTTEAPKPNVR